MSRKKPTRVGQPSNEELKQTAKEVVAGLVAAMATTTDVEVIDGRAMSIRWNALRRNNLFTLSSLELGARDCVAACVQEGGSPWLHVFIRDAEVWFFVKRNLDESPERPSILPVNAPRPVLITGSRRRRVRTRAH